MVRDARRARSRAGPTRRLRPSEVRRQAQTRRAVLILGVSALAVVGVGVALALNRTPPTDPQTGCIIGQATPAAHTLVLVDQTDPLSSHQIDYVKALILAEYARLKPYGELTVRGVRADPDDAGESFSRCRVRRGAEVLGVASNPDMIEAAFRRTVGDALNGYLNGLRHVPTAPRGELARDLHGVQVRIHYVRRPDLESIQTAAQRDFWRDWFVSQGAGVKLGWGLQLADGRR